MEWLIFINKSNDALKPATDKSFVYFIIVCKFSSALFYLALLYIAADNHQEAKDDCEWRYAQKGDPSATKSTAHGALQPFINQIHTRHHYQCKEERHN